MGLGPDGAGPEVKPVGRGAGERGTEILITDREGIGEGVVKGQVFPGVIPQGHRQSRVGLTAGGFGDQPAVVMAFTARGGLVGPRMRQALHPGGFGFRQAERERRMGFSGSVGLQPDRQAVRQDDGPGIGKTTHPAQGAETVIERPVLLHQDHHMFCILPGAAGRGIDRHGPSDAGRQGTHCSEGGGLFEEIATGIHGRGWPGETVRGTLDSGIISRLFPARQESAPSIRSGSTVARR